VASPASFDVEQFRGLARRHAVARRADRPTLVLGSTQAADVVDQSKAEQSGVEVVRRRGGGGAVLLQPGDHVWIDAWIPRDDPLWSADVSAAAAWVGQWWLDAFGVTVGDDWSVHEGRATPGDLGHLVCFAGRGPGEVFYSDRKVVGLSQWRSREGALFQACAYARWRPEDLIDVFNDTESQSHDLVKRLTPLAVGLEDLDPPVRDLSALRDALLSSFPAWGSDAIPPL
jgi:lipoate---protein ligase